MLPNRLWLSLSLLTAASPCLADTFLVTSTEQFGPGTLDEAIFNANDNPGADRIEFAIPGDGPHVIALNDRARESTGELVIDGYSQAGSSPNSAAQGSNAVLKIELDGSTAQSFDPAFQLQAAPLTLRGLAIHGFGLGAIAVSGLGAEGDGAAIEGCWLGLRADGTLGTSIRFGATLSNGSGIRIGGPALTQRNVIANFSDAGLIVSEHARDIAIQNNLIGLRPDGATPAGGPNGVQLVLGATADLIDNVIAQNQIGVNVGHTGSRARLSGNRIFGNGSLGIDLNIGLPDGVTANDPDDADVGANQLQNFPVLTSAAADNGTTVIAGTLDHPDIGASYRLEFFASEACDDSSNGEGEIFLGGVDVAFGANEDSFEVSVATEAPPGSVVTATATEIASGNSSEFSACLASTSSRIFRHGFED